MSPTAAAALAMPLLMPFSFSAKLEVKPKIEQFLEGQNRDKQTGAFVNGLRAKGKVEVFI